MTKASKLVAQLEEQASQMEARLRKKDERLKTLSGHIQELKAQLRKVEKERDWLAGEFMVDEDCDEPFGPCPHRKGKYTCTATREEHLQCLIKTAKEAVK